MTSLREWRPFALGCCIVLSVSMLIAAETDTGIVPAGRRKRAEAQQSASRAANRNRKGVEQQPQPANRAAALPTTPAQQPQPMPRKTTEGRVDPLRQLAERAIDTTSKRYLDADEHTPWQIMHGMVALRRDFELVQRDGKINCVEFISNAPRFRGETWWQVTPHGGRAHPFSVAYAFEGHVNQFLALLSMSNLPLTHEFNVDGTRTVTMADMVNNAKLSVNDREEITWTLWFLTHYIDIDTEWTNAAGEPWSMERLVDMQTRGKVTGAPCGGTHGLFAIAYARNAFLQKHGRLRGVYFQADQKIKQHIELARSMQNYDGSFSSEFFKGPGHSRDFNERLKASGHMLEWIMMALPQNRIREPWVRRAVASIATDLIHNASQPAECGPLYHALNSLIMYRDRTKLDVTPSGDEPLVADGNTSSDGDHPLDEPSQRAATPDQRVAEQPAQNPIPAESKLEAFAITPAPVDEAFGNPRKKADPAVARSEALAMRAALRLAERYRRQVEFQDVAEEERPSLLRVPANGARRMATDPTDHVTR